MHELTRMFFETSVTHFSVGEDSSLLVSYAVSIGE
jgi:hypothetical protein